MLSRSDRNDFDATKPERTIKVTGSVLNFTILFRKKGKGIGYLLTLLSTIERKLYHDLITNIAIFVYFWHKTFEEETNFAKYCKIELRERREAWSADSETIIAALFCSQPTPAAAATEQLTHASMAV